MVFHRSIVNWGGGYMYSQYMYILLYVKLMWCNCTPQIYCQLEWGVRCTLSICAFCYMSNLCGVIILHSSIVNWSGGQMYPQYICILLYVTLIWCNGIPQIYCQLGYGEYMYLQYMCIMLHVKVIWCNGIAHIYCQWAVDVCSIYVHSVIYETYLL